MFALGDIWSIVFCIVLRVRSGFGMVIRSDVCLMLNHLNGKSASYRYHLHPPDSWKRNGLLPLLGEKAPIFSRLDQVGQQRSFVLSAVSYTKKPQNHRSISFYLCSCDQKEDATLQLDAQAALWEFLLRLWYFGVFLQTFLVLVLMFILYLVVYIWYTTVMKPISFSWTIQRPLAVLDSKWSTWFTCEVNFLMLICGWSRFFSPCCHSAKCNWCLITNCDSIRTVSN